MTSQIRVDEITNRSGLGTVTIYDNGFEFTGVTTFTEDVDITGGLTIGGVLTYEDVTNVDSVGVVTARAGIRVTGDSIHVESSEDRLLYLKSTDANAYLTFEDTDSSSAFANRVGTVSDGLYFSTGGGGERVRIDSNGYLGLNNSAPHNQYYNNLVIGDGSAAGDKGITIRTQSSNEGVIAFSDADSGAARYAGKIAYNHGTNAMMFFTTNGDERLRIDDAGRLLIGRTSVLASSAERLTINDGMAMFRRNNANAAALYIRNEDSTADTRQPYLIFMDGSGNRGGFGVQYNESSLWISGQNGIAFRTGGTAPSTTERLRIDSSGNAILKTANGAFKSENPNSSGDYVRMYAGAGTAQWDIYGNGELLRMSENSGNSAARVQFDLPTTHRSTSTTTGIAALTAQQEVNNGGYLIFDGKNSSGTSVFNVTHNGRVRVSDGIDFSATGDASGMTSELLDDYEEGTWTPTIRLDGGTANGTTLTPESTSYKGRYVKIGDMVFVEAYVRYNFSSLSGTWTTTVIQGLPYTQGNQSSQQYTPVHIGYLSNFYSGFPTTNNNFPGGYVRSGQSDLVLTINNPNGAETTISNSVLSSSASGGIMFSAYYRDSASG